MSPWEPAPASPGAPDDSVAALTPPAPPEPVVLRSPTARVAMRLPGCSVATSEPPRARDLGEVVRPVRDELSDRALGLLRGGEVRGETRAALVAILQPEPAGHADAVATLARSERRLQDGFDLARAGALVAGLWALQRGAPGEARGWADELDGLEGDPPSPLGPVLRALADDAAGRSPAGALAEAFARDPEEPAIAVAHAARSLREGRAEDARDALVAYRAVMSDDEWAAAMTPRVEARVEALRRLEATTRDGVTLHHALEEARAAEIHRTLLEALDDAARLLGTPRRAELVAIVYPDRAAFRAATCGPAWSGALFDGAMHLPPEPFAGAELRPAARATLRHESLHAQLGEVAPRAPLWLQEGTAQLLEERELPARARSLALLARERTYIPFPSLEGSFVVIDDRQSALLAYHQSYAMVAASLEADPRALERAVAHLRAGGDPEDVLAAMSDRPLDGPALLAWIDARAE